MVILLNTLLMFRTTVAFAKVLGWSLTREGTTEPHVPSLSVVFFSKAFVHPSAFPSTTKHG